MEKAVREIIENQIELWELIKDRLNAIDDERGEVRFMDLHNPIGRLQKALKYQEKKNKQQD